MNFKHGKNLTIKNEQSVFIDSSVIIGDNVTIYENNRIEGNTVIENGVTILPNSFIRDTVIGENTEINCSQTDKAIIGKNCSIGPFARLRPNAVLDDEVKIGNFVEVKNANVGKGTKISHLAYVGDADIGKDCNIGCGAIFVNYNGREKNRTKVGDECFIGSNCNVIAPVEVSSRSYICAGTTITEDVKTDDFVIGRVRQEIKENRAHK